MSATDQPASQLRDRPVKGDRCPGGNRPDGWKSHYRPDDQVHVDGREQVCRPPLLLVAHGSRDPRFAPQLAAVAEGVRALESSLPVALGFLELSTPSVAQAVVPLIAAGQGSIVVVPMLLGSAFHAEIDLPVQLEQAMPQRGPQAQGAATKPASPLAGDSQLHQAPVLGTDPAMADALESQARQLDRCDGIVLLGAGSSDPRPSARLAAQAEDLSGRLGQPVETAFVTRSPSLDEAVGRLARRGVRRPGLVPWFLAAGVLLDRGLRRASELGVREVAPTLADGPRLPAIVLSRYHVVADQLAVPTTASRARAS